MKKEHRGKLFSFETALFFLFKNSWNIKKIYIWNKKWQLALVAAIQTIRWLHKSFIKKALCRHICIYNWLIKLHLQLVND